MHERASLLARSETRVCRVANLPRGSGCQGKQAGCAADKGLSIWWTQGADLGDRGPEMSPLLSGLSRFPFAMRDCHNYIVLTKSAMGLPFLVALTTRTWSPLSGWNSEPFTAPAYVSTTVLVSTLNECFFPS